MNVLHILVVVIACILSGCVGTPMKYEKRTDASVSHATCPTTFEADAIMKYGYPERWKRRELREEPRVYPLYKCGYLQPLIEWAKKASNHENEWGGCDLQGHASFTCKSQRGPSGTSRRGGITEFRGSGAFDAALATGARRSCAGMASERRELTVRVWENHVGRHEWEFVIRLECYS